MPKLPYTKTTIRDISQFTNIGDGSTGFNIATIINSKTGPFKRMTLNSFDDLINYYCTGTQVSKTDDQTIQCVGALLNTTAVDVIRVGNPKILVGKTNTNKIFYTDSNYNVIDILTNIKLNIDTSNSKNVIGVDFNNTLNYISDDYVDEDVENRLNTDDKTPINLSNFVNLFQKRLPSNLINFTNDSIYTRNEENINSSNYVKVIESYIDSTIKLTTEDFKLSDNYYILINNKTYIYNQDNLDISQTLIKPVKITWYDKDNPMSTKKYLANVVAELSESEMGAYLVKYDFSKVVFNDNKTSSIFLNRLNNGKEYIYSKNEKFDKFNITVKLDNNNELTIVYNDKDTYDTLRDTNPYTYFINDSETDFSKILTIIENTLYKGSIFSVEEQENNIMDELPTELISVSTAEIYFNSETQILLSSNLENNSSTIFIIEELDNGIYNYKFSLRNEYIDSYYITIDGVSYYCGDTPTSVEINEFVMLNEDKLSYRDFITNLLSKLQSDMIIGLVNSQEFFIQGEPNIDYSPNIKCIIRKLNQNNTISNAKFGLVTKFLSEKPLFSYEFSKNNYITNYDVIDLTWKYNQITRTITIGFGSDDCDDFGTLLNYSKYNEGEDSNEYVHIIHFNEDIKVNSMFSSEDEVVSISLFGNEIILPEPTVTDYSSAIKKYIDYEDKQYSFIWDAGYASPVLARAMNQVAVEKNSQFVPSFPVTIKNVDDALSYHKSLGLNTFQGIEVVPGHKGSYCGSFLTTVPGSLSYMIARINSYNNSSSEFQPLFGPRRGVVVSPNLIWNINKNDQQKLADFNINSIVNNINGTYLNYNLTSQKVTSYLSEEQNVYISNVIAHICEAYNPSIISEANTPSLWNNLTNQLTRLLEERLISGKNPTINAIRVICNEKLNTQDVIEARQLKYKVEVQYNLSTAFVQCYVDVVRLNSF